MMKRSWEELTKNLEGIKHMKLESSVRVHKM
jgi:ribosomal protein S2